MPKLGNLRRPELVTGTFEVFGERVTATFDRAAVTMHWARLAQEPDMMPAALETVVESWDITNDDGTPFPPTAENIAMLPMPVIKAMCDELGSVSVPSDGDRKNSSGPPSIASVASEEQHGTPQNGPVTSRLPVS